MAGTQEQEKEWAVFAKTMGYYDFHQLDTCEYCGGICDCWTKHYTDEQRANEGIHYHYRSEWICAKCGAVTDELCDEDMIPIHGNAQ